MAALAPRGHGRTHGPVPRLARDPGNHSLAITWIVNGIVALIVVIDEYVWPVNDDNDEPAQEAADAVEN